MANICTLQTGTWTETTESVNNIKIHNFAGQNSWSGPCFQQAQKNVENHQTFRDSDTANWVRHANPSAFQKGYVLQRFPKLLSFPNCWYSGLRGTISNSTDSHTSQNSVECIPYLNAYSNCLFPTHTFCKLLNKRQLAHRQRIWQSTM